LSRQRKDVALRAADKAAKASERAAEQTSPRRRRSVPYRGLSAGDFSISSSAGPFGWRFWRKPIT